MHIVLLGGLRWLKQETSLAEMGSRAEAVEFLGLKPCWEGRVEYPVPPRRTVYFLPVRAERLGGRRGPPWSLGFPVFKIGIMTEFFQIAGMSTPATERLKNSIKKVRPCSPRWRRWSMVSPSGR